MSKFPYKRIISYGCSFTAGAEITDHDFIGITEEELATCARRNGYTGSRELYEHFSVDEDTRRKILESNREKSWPNYIAQRYNIPLLNQAIPGSSLSHASYCILRDIHSNVVQPTDLILVGITSPNRWFQFTETGRPFFGVFNRGWNLLKHSPISKTYRLELERNWFNMYNTIYTHHKEILFLSNLSDKMNGQIKLCYALATPKEMFSRVASSYTSEQDLEFFDLCDKIIPNNNFLYAEKSMSDLTRSIDDTTAIDAIHMFGHPRVEYHKKFANILIEKLEEMYND